MFTEHIVVCINEHNLAEKNSEQKQSYPTVVMVTRAHQNPSVDPRPKEDGKWWWFELVSYPGKVSLVFKEMDITTSRIENYSFIIFLKNESLQFRVMYRRRAFLHWFTEEGMDEMQFKQVRKKFLIKLSSLRCWEHFWVAKRRRKNTAGTFFWFSLRPVWGSWFIYYRHRRDISI